jgi:predicted nucleic acid-binding protein
LSIKKNKPIEEMTVLIDTSIIVDVDGGNEEAIDLCKRLTGTNRAMLSTVSVSEILTGSYLRRDYNASVNRAGKVLGQFIWISLNGEVAKLIGQINAYLISKGLPIEYQDMAVVASCLVEHCDVLLTENKDHFERIPKLRGRVMTPKDLLEKYTV